jgi:hypothetical protein
MGKLVVFGLIWGMLLLLILPAVAPIEYGTTETGGDAYVLTTPENIQEGDTVYYWDNATQSFRLSAVDRTTSTGYVVAGSPERRTNTTVVPAFAVIGTPVTVSGEPLAIPFVGTVVPLVQSLTSPLIVAFLTASVVIGAVLRERMRTRQRNILRVRHVMKPLLGIVVLSTLAIPLLTASTYQIAYEAGEQTSGTADGKWTEQQIPVRYRTPLFSHLIVETTTDDLRRWKQDGQVVRVTLTAPTDGEYSTSLSIFPYLAVLPRAIIQQLHAIHPAIATAGTSGVISAPLLAVYALFIDGTKPAPRLFQTLIE